MVQGGIFAGEFQGGPYIEVFSTQGSNPVEKWKISNPKSIKKVYEKSVKSYVYCVEGGHGSKMQIPSDERKSTGLTQPFLVFQLFLPVATSFSFELSMSDCGGTRRRLIFSSAFAEVKRTPLHCQLPLHTVRHGMWLNLVLNLPELTACNFIGQTFSRLDGIVIGTNCKLRKIFTLKSAPLTSDDNCLMLGGEPIPRNCDFTPGTESITQMFTVDQGPVEDSGRPMSEPDAASFTSSKSQDRLNQKGEALAFGSRVRLPKTRERDQSQVSTPSTAPNQGQGRRPRPSQGLPPAPGQSASSHASNPKDSRGNTNLVVLPSSASSDASGLNTPSSLASPDRRSSPEARKSGRCPCPDIPSLPAAAGARTCREPPTPPEPAVEPRHKLSPTASPAGKDGGEGRLGRREGRGKPSRLPALSNASSQHSSPAGSERGSPYKRALHHDMGVSGAGVPHLPGSPFGDESVASSCTVASSSATSPMKRYFEDAGGHGDLREPGSTRSGAAPEPLGKLREKRKGRDREQHLGGAEDGAGALGSSAASGGKVPVLGSHGVLGSMHLPGPGGAPGGAAGGAASAAEGSPHSVEDLPLASKQLSSLGGAAGAPRASRVMRSRRALYTSGSQEKRTDSSDEAPSSREREEESAGGSGSESGGSGGRRRQEEPAVAAAGTGLHGGGSGSGPRAAAAEEEEEQGARGAGWSVSNRERRSLSMSHVVEWESGEAPATGERVWEESHAVDDSYSAPKSRAAGALSPALAPHAYESPKFPDASPSQQHYWYASNPRALQEPLHHARGPAETPESPYEDEDEDEDADAEEPYEGGAAVAERGSGTSAASSVLRRSCRTNTDRSQSPERATKRSAGLRDSGGLDRESSIDSIAESADLSQSPGRGPFASGSTIRTTHLASGEAHPKVSSGGGLSGESAPGGDGWGLHSHSHSKLGGLGAHRDGLMTWGHPGEAGPDRWGGANGFRSQEGVRRLESGDDDDIMLDAGEGAADGAGKDGPSGRGLGSTADLEGSGSSPQADRTHSDRLEESYLGELGAGIKHQGTPLGPGYHGGTAAMQWSPEVALPSPASKFGSEGLDVSVSSSKHLVSNRHIFTPPVIPASKLNDAAFQNTVNLQNLSPNRGSSGEEEDKLQNSMGEEDLDLMYDPILNFYYDPKTNKYYELL